MILRLTLILSFVMPSLPVFADNSRPQNAQVLAEIHAFLAEYHAGGWDVPSTNKEVGEILKTASVQQEIDAYRKALLVGQTGPETPDEKFVWLKLRDEKIKKPTREIAEHLFALRVEEINATLMVLLKNFLFNDDDRAGIKEIFEALNAYRFNPDELYRLRKEASYIHAYSKGFIVSTLAVTGASAILAVKGGPSVWESLRGVASHLWESAAAKFETRAAKAVDRMDPNSAEAILAGMERSKLWPEKRVIKESLAMKGRLTGEKLSRLPGYRTYLKIEKATMARGLRGIAFIVGIGTVGGGANVGFKALANALDPEDYSNTVIDFNDWADNDYDYLAALRLTCVANQNFETLNKVSSGDIVPYVVQVNVLASQYEILRSINKSLQEEVELPPNVTVDSATGQVKFVRQIPGHTQVEGFNCPMLKGRDSALPLRVSTSDVLNIVDKMAAHINQIAQANEKAKAEKDAEEKKKRDENKPKEERLDEDGDQIAPAPKKPEDILNPTHAKPDGKKLKQ